MNFWEQVVGQPHTISIPAIVMRCVISYLALLTIVRLGGYQEIRQMSAVGFIVSITIGSAVGNAITQPDVSIWEGIAAAAAFIGMQVLFAFGSQTWPWFRRIVAGVPLVLIEQGRIREDRLKQARMNIDRLMQFLREKNVARAADVEFAVLEVDGQLSVVKKSEASPVTPKDLGLPTAPATLGRVVYADKQIREDQLAELGLSKSWLMRELVKRGVTDLSQVVVIQADSSGGLYVDLKNDAAPLTANTSKQALRAALEQAHADLLSFSLDTNNQNAREFYEKQVRKVESLLERLEPHLRA